MDNPNDKIAILRQRQREELEEALRGKHDEALPKVRSLILKLKRPGLEKLFGENPMRSEEFEELAPYFNMRRVSQ